MMEEQLQDRPWLCGEALSLVRAETPLAPPLEDYLSRLVAPT